MVADMLDEWPGVDDIAEGRQADDERAQRRQLYRGARVVASEEVRTPAGRAP